MVVAVVSCAGGIAGEEGVSEIATTTGATVYDEVRYAFSWSESIIFLVTLFTFLFIGFTVCAGLGWKIPDSQISP